MAAAETGREFPVDPAVGALRTKCPYYPAAPTTPDGPNDVAACSSPAGFDPSLSRQAVSAGMASPDRAPLGRTRRPRGPPTPLA